MAVFGQQQCRKLTADDSRSVRKCILVKQSTLSVALLVPRHRYGCICTTHILCHYNPSLRGVVSRIDNYCLLNGSFLYSWGFP